jgi:hypothetical protein
MINNIKISALVVACFLTITTFASAENVIGVTGTLAKIEASGTETEGTATDTSDRTKSVSNSVGYGSIYLENIRDNGIAIGIEYVPFSADVSDKVHSRTDTSQAGSGEGRSGTTVNTANAEIENYRTVYVEVPMKSSTYFRLGFSQVDVNTTENVVTNGGNYGNATLDGYNLGLGIKGETSNGLRVKMNLQYTDFEDLSLSSSTNNSISADLDVTALNISVGKAF